MTKQVWLEFHSVFYGALAGGIGGLVGWLLTKQPGFVHTANPILRSDLMIFDIAVISGCIGATLGTVDGVLHGLYTRASQGALIGALFGIIGGVVGRLLGEPAFQVFSHLNLTLLGHSIGWVLIGLFIGVTEGVMYRDRIRALRGSLGGLLGGYWGSGGFEIINDMPYSAINYGLTIVMLGVALGVLIRFCQEWFADAYLVVISNIQKNDKFNLTKLVSVLGSGVDDDFILHTGKEIRPNHAHLLLKANTYWIQPTHGECVLYVNQQPVFMLHRLHHADEITIGSLTLRFIQKTVYCPHCTRKNSAERQVCLSCKKPLTNRKFI